MSQQEYVWYASYGSNINKDRFLCYILGGKPEGSEEEEIGSRDNALPIDERPFLINHQLYFAKEAQKWQGKGVAFIDIEHNPDVKTYSTMYLITREQFNDVVRQENKNQELEELDLETIIEEGSKVFRSGKWYGNVIYIGTADGHPVFTFTAPSPMDPSELNRPSENYFKTIIKGLKREVGLSDQEVFQYFKEVPGIAGNYADNELETIIQSTEV